MVAEKTARPKFRREQEWVPKTRVGRLVKMGKITSIEEIFRSSYRIKEPEIVDHLLGKANLREELIASKSVQKQSKAGQKTSMKACVIIGNCNGYIGIGTHSSREMSVAIKGAIARAKMNMIPVRMGQWDGDSGNKHTVAVRASGKCGSVTVKLIPATMGTGFEVSEVHRKIFELAGLKDIYVKSYGCTKTTENMAKATILALENSSNMFIPSQWEAAPKRINPVVEHAEVLAQFENATF
ncbi:small subunit ribosomal protein S2e [Pancytospora philotis]|nr:small subunit ribosomal protein S2e [Pancytospora philotis]